MEIKILNEDKNLLEFEIDNLTIAELLRVYLNLDDKVTFAAWRRLHPTENPVVKVETSGKDVKKAVEDAVKSVVKEFEKIEKDFSKI